MKKAKIYKPNKTAMQSGLGKIDKWVLEFKTKDPTINPLMGWEISSDNYTELKLEFSSKDLAINFMYLYTIVADYSDLPSFAEGNTSPCTKISLNSSLSIIC